MSRTKHSHERGTPLAYRRWCRRNMLVTPSDTDRRGEYRWDLEDGWREYEDTAVYLGEPLDYVTTEAYHAADAAMDRRGGYQSLDRVFSKRMRVKVRPPAYARSCGACAWEQMGAKPFWDHTCAEKGKTP